MSAAPDLVRVYLWRDQRFARNEDTVVCVAPRDAVISVFGGGGMWNLDGLHRAFGGGIVFYASGQNILFQGVWGKRNASRFRTAFRQRGFKVMIIRAACPFSWRANWAVSYPRPRYRPSCLASI